MKRTARVFVLACLVTAGPLFAQSGTIAVKKGATLTYATDMKMDMNQSIQGQDILIKMGTDGTVALSAKDVTAGGIDWIYDIQQMHMTMQIPMIPGNSHDTTIKGTPIPFSTDMAGRISNLESIAADPTLAAFSGGLLGNVVAEMFSPVLSRTLKVGDSWEESTVDTISNQALQGVKLLMKKTTRFTYQGTVDTLKTKAARIRAEATSMTMGGDGAVNGMNIRMDGDGTSIGTRYYSVADGLLLNSSTEMAMNMRMVATGATGMVIPISYKLTTATVRNGG